MRVLPKSYVKYLPALSPREERVMRMIFGIGNERRHTFAEIGEFFIVTRERVHWIEKRALRKLRDRKWRTKNTKIVNEPSIDRIKRLTEKIFGKVQ